MVARAGRFRDPQMPDLAVRMARRQEPGRRRRWQGK